MYPRSLSTLGIGIMTLFPISIGRKIWLLLDTILSSCYDKLLPLAIRSLWIWFGLVQSSHVYLYCSFVWNKELYIVYSCFTIHRYRNIIGLIIIILQGVNSTICIIQCRPHYYTFTLTSSSQRHTSTTLIISAIEEKKMLWKCSANTEEQCIRLIKLYIPWTNCFWTEYTISHFRGLLFNMYKKTYEWTR